MAATDAPTMTDSDRRELAEWAALDAYAQLEKAQMGSAAALVAAHRDVEPLIALIELLHREAPREADGTWPTEHIATALAVATRWLRLYERERDDGARKGEHVATRIIEALEMEGRI